MSEQKKEQWQFLRNCLLILAAGILIGTVAVTLAYLCPVNEELQQRSYQSIAEEGGYPAMPYIGTGTYFSSYLPGVLDGGTDAVMLYTAEDTSQENLLVRAMRMFNAYSQGQFTYYWQGYVVILRPLLLLFDYGEIRILNSVGQLLLVLGICCLIKRKKGTPYVFLYLTSYFLMMPMALSMSLQFTWVFYITAGGCLFVLLKPQRLEKYGYLYFFLLLGMLTSYFDMLTYPLVTWGIPLVWWLVLQEKGRKSESYLKQVIASGISWIAGYGLMWAGKWVIAGVVLKENIMKKALDEVLFRSGTLEGEAVSLADRFTAMYENWKHYEYKLYFLLLAVWLFWVIVRSIRRGFQESSKCAAFGLVGLSSFVWYFVLANHTQGHHFFTYRIYAVTILAVLAIALEVLLPVTRKSVLFSAATLNRCAVWIILGVLSILCVLPAKEQILAINGSAPAATYLLEEGQTAETQFTPTFSEIIEFGYGLSTHSTTGECTISILQQDSLLYQETAALAQLDRGSLYQVMPVDWKLKAGETYTMRITVQGNNREVYLGATEPGYLLLNEYRSLQIGEQEIDGQLLSGLRYWTMPTSRKTRLFIACSWLGLLAAYFTVGKQIWKEKLCKTADNNEN